MALIECCLSNVSGTARLALNDSDHRVRESLCLDRCGNCHDEAFVVVEGALYTGDSHEQLLQGIDDGEVIDA